MSSAYAARYRAARGYAGLTQEELADKLGLSDQTIKRREKGTLAGTTGDRIATATICGVPVEFMEGGWGALQPDEIRDLLQEQRDLLRDIQDATSPLKQVIDRAMRGLPGDAADPEAEVEGPEHKRTPPASSSPPA